MPQMSPMTWTLLVTFLMLTMFVISTSLPAYSMPISKKTKVPSKEKAFMW